MFAINTSLRAIEQVPLSESASRALALHPQMRSPARVVKLSIRVIEHMPRTAQDCCTIEWLVSEPACTYHRSLYRDKVVHLSLRSGRWHGPHHG